MTITENTAASAADQAPKPLIYVAGPITGDPHGCVRRALPAFDWLTSNGAVPFLPQLTVIAEMIQPRHYEAWMTYDLDVIDRCDALVRLPGDSPGADREVTHAHQRGLPVFAWPEGASLLDAWLNAWADTWADKT